MDITFRPVTWGYEPNNEIASRLYARMGVAPTGKMIRDEIIARLELETSR